MREVNLGIIGLGNWPREAYVPNLKKMPGANVIAVAARTEQTRAFARGEFGQDIATYDDYAGLLGDDDVEAVMIAVPNRLHAEVVSAAAQTGKHLFFEPPIGLNEEEIRSTLAALEATDGIVQIDHEIRCAPVMGELQRRLAEGIIGDPLMARVRLWVDWGFGGRDWVEDVEAQGFFLWLGCWYLDMLDCVFAQAPVRADVAGGQAMNGALTDHGWAILQYPEGRSGAIEFSLINCAGREVSLHVLGSEGEMFAEMWDGILRWRTKDQDWQELSVPCEQPAHGFAGMYESLAGFVGAVAEGTPVLANLDVIRRVHKAVIACSKAEAQSRSIAIE